MTDSPSSLMLLRTFRQHPALAAAVIVMLAVSVGALTTTFGMASAALVRPPPFRDPQRLAILYTTHTGEGRPLHNERWSFARIGWLRDHTVSWSDLANYTGTDLVLTGSGDTEAIRGEIVSPSYFGTLGERAAIGRTLLPGEDDPAAREAVVVLGHALWQRRFGGDRAVVGRTMRVNGVTLTIVGIMAPGFRGLTDVAELWVPTALAPVLTYPEYLVSDQNFISAVGRLRPGASWNSANDEMQRVTAQAYAAIPDAEADPSHVAGGVAVPLNTARAHPRVRAAVLLLLGTVALLHLLACANTTSLLLGHALGRAHESAVRAALGGTPRRLFVSHLASAGLLATAGGALGTLLAAAASPFVAVPTGLWGPRNFYGALAAFASPGFSWRTVAFGAVVTCGSALLVAALPAAMAVRGTMLDALRDGPRGSSRRGASLRRPSARGAIVAAETALAVVLLVAGGLMVDSFNRMRHVDLGIESGGVLTFTIQPSETRVPVRDGPAYVRRMLAAITTVPGVVSATVDGGAPVSGTARSTLYIAGRPLPRAADAPPVLRHYVAPDHFRTLGIPVIRGRAFDDGDVAGRPHVAIISETAARRFWPGADPIGQRVWFGGGSTFDRPDSSAEVVGIAGDVMYEPLDAGPNRSSVYTPYAQFTYGWRVYFVRLAVEPSSAVAAIRDAVRRVDADVPLTGVQTLSSLIGASWSRQRYDAFFFGSFAVVALLLAVSGIYAVVAFAVTQRTREMGIRLALGASPAAVLRLVVGEGMAFPLIGLGLGLVAAAGTARVLRASLYGIGPYDPRVLSITAAVLVLSAVAACLGPARRATRVDPNEALRAP